MDLSIFQAGQNRSSIFGKIKKLVLTEQSTVQANLGLALTAL
jgi:hypothetical protein